MKADRLTPGETGGDSSGIFRGACFSDSASADRMPSIMDDMFFCTFFADTGNLTLFFLHGPAVLTAMQAAGGMDLPAFIQYICEADRADAARKYSLFFTEAAAGRTDKVTFRHSFMPEKGRCLWLQVYMQAVSREGGCSVWGGMIDKTPSSPESIITEILSKETDEFAVYYDAAKDTCYLNTHLMCFLGVPTNRIENAAAQAAKYIHPDDFTACKREAALFLAHKRTSFSREFRIVSPDKKEVWLHSCGFTDFNAGGGARYISGTFTDITERKQIELLQRDIIDGTSAVVFVADTDNSVISFSENIRRFFPKACLHMQGNILDTINGNVLPEDRNRVIEPIRQLMGSKSGKYSCEFRIFADNEIVWVASRGKSFFDTSRQSHMIVGTIFSLDDMNHLFTVSGETGSRHEITDLPVRAGLLADTERVIHDRNVFSAALILIDIREFHTFNDRFGRGIGDEVLKGVSNKLAERLPSGASLYHINTDTFCILWPHASRVQIDRFMSYSQEESKNPLLIGKEYIYITYCMSGALFPSCGSSADELLLNAEITLHKVKQEKRARYAIFSLSDKKEMTEKLDFELQLARSIRNAHDNFLLYYQPLVSASGEKLIGAEALLRWLSPAREIISPEKVIAGLEATGHMDNVGAWVLEQGILQCRVWLDSGADSCFFMHINITAEDLMRPKYASNVLSLLRKYALSPENLILEITESSLMKSFETCRKNLVKLRNAGVRISLDDFGSGYSSLNYLRELPVDEVKIDRAFIEDVQKDQYNHSFISAIVLLAHSISADVCIEGVESHEQADTVRALEADVFQGYYFGRPVPSVEFETRYFLNQPAIF